MSGRLDGVRVGPWHTDDDGDRSRYYLEPWHYGERCAVWVLQPGQISLYGVWRWHGDGGHTGDYDSAEAAEAAADAYLTGHGAVFVDDPAPPACVWQVRVAADPADPEYTLYASEPSALAAALAEVHGVDPGGWTHRRIGPTCQEWSHMLCEVTLDRFEVLL